MEGKGGGRQGGKEIKEIIVVVERSIWSEEEAKY